MSHWLHCNGCYCQPDSVELRFYITNCSHIYCEKCVTPCTKERCKVCRSQCTTLMLGGKIPKEVESLFADPVDLHQKMTKQFYQTVEFQKSHQRRLLRRFKEKLKAFEYQINEVRDVIMQAKSMEREFMKLKTENDYLKLLLSKKMQVMMTTACLSVPNTVAKALQMQDGHPRSASRAGISPSSFSGVSTCQTLQFGKSQVCGSAQQRNFRGTSNILTQPGRLLVRTPPSDGHFGTVGGSNFTPSSVGSKSASITPMSDCFLLKDLHNQQPRAV